jgi:hypothetical protein
MDFYLILARLCRWLLANKLPCAGVRITIEFPSESDLYHAQFRVISSVPGEVLPNTPAFGPFPITLCGLEIDFKKRDV